MFGSWISDEHGRRFYMPFAEFPLVDIAAVYEPLSTTVMLLDQLQKALEELPVDVTHLLARHDAVQSSGAEGTTSTFYDTLIAEQKPEKSRDLVDAQTVLSVFNAYQKLSEVKLSPERAARLIHGFLFPKGASKWQDFNLGQYKTALNGTQDSEMPGGMFYFSPPHKTSELMKNWQHLTLKGGQRHRLIDQAISHWLFEHIHPFKDGNGRVGRLIPAFVLWRERVTKAPIAFFGDAALSDKTAYIEAMKMARRTGQFEGWCSYFFHMIGQTAQANLKRINGIATLLEAWEAQLEGLRRDSSARALVYAFLKNPVMSVVDAQSALNGRSFNAINNGITELLARGILRITLGHQRDRLFAMPEILALFETD
jgi:Fic family protein